MIRLKRERLDEIGQSETAWGERMLPQYETIRHSGGSFLSFVGTDLLPIETTEPEARASELRAPCAKLGAPVAKLRAPYMEPQARAPKLPARFTEPKAPRPKPGACPTELGAPSPKPEAPRPELCARRFRVSQGPVRLGDETLRLKKRSSRPWIAPSRQSRATMRFRVRTERVFCGSEQEFTAPDRLPDQPARFAGGKLHALKTIPDPSPDGNADAGAVWQQPWSMPPSRRDFPWL